MAKKEKLEKVQETEKEKIEETVEEKEETKEEALEKEIQKLKDEANSINDKYLRLLAEFDNYKRRTQKEKEGTYDLAVGNTVNDIIPILDTLEISMKNETGNVESVLFN